MTLHETSRIIESEAFSAECNLASGLLAFRTLVMAQPAFLNLKHLLAAGRQGTGKKIEEDVRLDAILLIMEDCDPGYEHQGDVAVAAYLIALVDEGYVTQARRLAVRVLESEYGCWFWAKRVAREMIDVV